MVMRKNKGAKTKVVLFLTTLATVVWPTHSVFGTDFNQKTWKMTLYVAGRFPRITTPGFRRLGGYYLIEISNIPIRVTPSGRLLHEIGGDIDFIKNRPLAFDATVYISPASMVLRFNQGSSNGIEFTFPKGIQSLYGNGVFYLFNEEQQESEHHVFSNVKDPFDLFRVYQLYGVFKIDASKPRTYFDSVQFSKLWVLGCKISSTSKE